MKVYLKYLVLIILPLLKGSVSFAQIADRIKASEAKLQTVRQDTERAKILISLGKIFSMSNSYDSAMYYTNMGLNLSLNIDYLRGIAAAYSTIGNVYSDKGNYALAIQNYRQALDIFEKKGLKKSMSSIYNNIGIIYYNQGNYPLALKNYLASMKLKREAGDSVELANTYLNLGEMYLDMGNYKEALNYYLIVSKMAQTNKNQDLLGNSYLGIGDVYKAEGNYEQAEENEKLALGIASANGDIRMTDNVYSNYGDIYFQLGKYDSALVNYFKAIKINKELSDRKGMGVLFTRISRAYSAKKQYVPTRIYIDSALGISKTLGDKENIRDIYALLVHIDSAENRQSEIMGDFKMYLCYRDSLSNEESTRKMVSEQMEYDAERQQALDKIEQDKRASRQKLVRNLLTGGIGFVFLFAVIFFFQRRKISKERDRSDHLLLNILPAETAEELKNTGESKARRYGLVTVMFTDFKNFTKSAETMTAEQLVSEINFCYKEFDKINARHRVEKIKTMGDGYMAAGGVPIENTTNPEDTILAALEIQEFMKAMKAKREQENLPFFEVRIGIHSGPVIAGIVGLNKFAYDIWGVTVNIAARMESSGETGKVNISGTTYDLVKDKFKFTYRGKIQAKNKGELDMYFVEG